MTHSASILLGLGAVDDASLNDNSHGAVDDASLNDNSHGAVDDAEMGTNRSDV